MIRNLTLAVFFAALLLAMFAERLGAPVPLAQQAVLWFAAAGLAMLVLIAATSRLSAFLAGESEASLAGVVALNVILLLAANAALAAKMPLSLSVLASLTAGYLGGLMLLPAHRLEGNRACPVPAHFRQDEGIMLLFASGGVALAMLLTLFPDVTALPSTVSGAPFLAAPHLALLIAAVIAVSGGFAALRLIAGATVLLALIALALPAGAEFARELGALRNVFRETADWQALVPVMSALPPFRASGTITGLATGFAVALLAVPGSATLEGRWKRAGVPVIALLIAGLLAAAPLLGFARLDTLVATEIAGRTTQVWPVFAFDEGLRGWLWTCGRAPIDAFDVAQACRIAGIALPAPASALRIDAGLAPMAIAAMFGLPLILGVVWVLAVQAGLVVALAALLFRAGTAFSEGALHRLLHPRGLKAWRLLAARAVIIVICIALWQLDWRGVIDANALHMLLIGSLILASLVLVGHAIRYVVQALNRLRARIAARRSPPPADDAAPVPAE